MSNYKLKFFIQTFHIYTNCQHGVFVSYTYHTDLYYRLAYDYYCPSWHSCYLMSNLDACHAEYGENRYASCAEIATKLIGMKENCYNKQNCHYIGSTKHCLSYRDCYKTITGEVIDGPTKAIASVRYRTFEEWKQDNINSLRIAVDTLKTIGIIAGGALALIALLYASKKGYESYQRWQLNKKNSRQPVVVLLPVYSFNVVQKKLLFAQYERLG